MSSTDTNQASEDDIAIIEKIIRFNCPMGCDGNGSYPEMGSDGDWEQGQCQWCFEYGMPARDAIQSLIRTEKLKLLDKIVGIASNKQFKDYTKQDIASFFSRLGELERELEAEL